MEPIARRGTGNLVTRLIGALAIAAGLALLAAFGRTHLPSASRREAPPEPVAAEPEPVAAEPEPVAAEPEPVAAEPEPAAVQPEPVAVQPEPEPAAPYVWTRPAAPLPLHHWHPGAAA